MDRRTVSIALAALVASAAVRPAAAQQYPARPLRLIVGFAPGTGPDIVARVVGQKLAEGLGQAVVVDNKAGAGGIIAAQEAARAAPDGYTIMLGEVGQLSIAPSSYAKLPYDPNRDFAPIGEAVNTDFVLVVGSQSGVDTLQGFVEQAKAQKDLNFATFGAGTPGHFGAVAFADAAGLKAETVHYRSPADALGGLASGSVHAGFITVGVATSHVKAGRLRALATTGASRSAALPDAPTLTEAGYPLAFAAWFGFVAPAGTPTDVLDTLSTVVAKAVQAPEVRTKLEGAGFRMVGSSRADFARLIQSDAARWGAIVKATGFRATLD